MVFSNKIKTFNLGLLSKYRTTLMGIAAIFIILCHIPQYGVEVHHTLRSILIYGNIGVDIFLFLSGLGCYYSCQSAVGFLIQKLKINKCK